MGVDKPMTLSNDCAASRACERRFLRAPSDNVVSFGKAIFGKHRASRCCCLKPTFLGN